MRVAAIVIVFLVTIAGLTGSHANLGFWTTGVVFLAVIITLLYAIEKMP